MLDLCRLSFVDNYKKSMVLYLVGTGGRLGNAACALCHPIARPRSSNGACRNGVAMRYGEGGFILLGRGGGHGLSFLGLWIVACKLTTWPIDGQRIDNKGPLRGK